MKDARFNPFSEALSNRLRGIHGVLKQTPPPRNIADAVADYERQMADPEAAVPEFRAILERHGPEGLVDYLEGSSRLKETWGL